MNKSVLMAILITHLSITMLLLTMLVWRKGWRFLSLLPLGIFFAVYFIVANVFESNINPVLGLLFWAFYIEIMIIFGMFEPNRPFYSKSQRRILELEKKVEELSKGKEGNNEK